MNRDYVALREALARRVAQVAAQVAREIAAPPAVPTRGPEGDDDVQVREARGACIALLKRASEVVLEARGWPAISTALVVLSAAAEVVSHARGLYDEETRDAGYLAECARDAAASADVPSARCRGLFAFLALPAGDRWMGE